MYCDIWIPSLVMLLKEMMRLQWTKILYINYQVLCLCVVVPGDFEGRRIVANGDHAAELFCRVECQLFERFSKSCSPFTWLFMRPPWAVNGACCKECVFNRMKTFVNQVMLCS